MSKKLRLKVVNARFFLATFESALYFYQGVVLILDYQDIACL
jgi:hypothetical protein